ncbi:MAG TPA: TIGR03936 family radical SAM-associated protein [Candidatus Limnocylindria bacterium]|nr:TIGR03936 family radical SAM-associated protein [Candidatus Limnocylindria bacterium]
MLVVFRKTGPARFVGHLDLLRAMQRALRRADLPVAYSQGFNPHLLLTFAAPLSVGVAGEREIMEVPLSAEMDPRDFLTRLQAVLPGDLMALEAAPLPDAHPAAMARLFAARYALRPQSDFAVLAAALPGFLALPSIPYMKKGKSGEKQDDLRPLVLDASARDGALEATLALREGASAKPSQFLESLAAFAGIPAPECLITRTGLLDNRLLPLEAP